MVGHQHIRMNATSACERCLLQAAQVTPIVGGSQEAGLSVVAALDNVLRDTGEFDTWQSGHGKQAEGATWAVRRCCRCQQALDIANGPSCCRSFRTFVCGNEPDPYSRTTSLFACKKRATRFRHVRAWLRLTECSIAQANGRTMCPTIRALFMLTLTTAWLNVLRKFGIRRPRNMELFR